MLYHIVQMLLPLNDNQLYWKFIGQLIIIVKLIKMPWEWHQSVGGWVGRNIYHWMSGPIGALTSCKSPYDLIQSVCPTWCHFRFWIFLSHKYTIKVHLSYVAYAAYAGTDISNSIFDEKLFFLRITNVCFQKRTRKRWFSNRNRAIFYFYCPLLLCSSNFSNSFWNEIYLWLERGRLILPSSVLPVRPICSNRRAAAKHGFPGLDSNHSSNCPSYNMP